MVYTIEGIIAFDDINDLAVLKIVERDTPFPIGASDVVRKGDLVLAVGYPDGKEDGIESTVHSVRNSGRHLNLKGLLAPGYSGGPVLNMEGAIGDLDVAIEHNCSYTQAYENRGKAKRALGQHSAAKADFERILQSKGRGDVSTQELERASTEMVRIPAGEFQMGSNEIMEATPRHAVYLDAFYMDPYEVTNAQFKAFVDANPEWRKDNIPSEYHNGNYLRLWDGNDYPKGKANHPVVYVSWYAAMAYAKWVGKRLPTEAEWERAARGGIAHKRYVWGNARNPGRANYGYYGRHTQPVGSYLPNGFGLYDMGGNVWELCLDEYNRNFYRHSQKRIRLPVSPILRR